MNKKTYWIMLSVLVLLLLLSIVPLAQAAAVCGVGKRGPVAKLLDCVTVEGVRQHQAAFQSFADANGGTRASGTPGYDASAAYVADKLSEAGYIVTLQPFNYISFTQTGPATLEQTAPGAVSYVEGTDFQLLEQTDPGEVTGTVTAVDLQLGLGNTSTSGCEVADFAGFPAGNIALIQRGTCTFEAKAENAAAAGAIGVIVFNQGNTPERSGLLAGTLGAGNTAGIPVVGTTYDLGVEWDSTPGLVMHMIVQSLRVEVITHNVIAETPWGRADNVVMAGAHLDSVSAGPGIQDNGSGSAAILEVALQMHKLQTRNKVRFAWWGAEEANLVGSNFYIANLSPEELENIALYLNFDMIGSPNFVRFIYDGDGSGFGLEGPPGSDAIEALFESFYDSRGLAHEPTEFSGRSDYQAFINNGIPAGGLFTGAEGIKTAEQAAIYGGTAGAQYDPCYHQACDTYDNISLEVLEQNADAVAFTVVTYAGSTESVNGVTGKGPVQPASLQAESSDATK
jgi:Zn-dependent M28 family amino/carboxypeptidase